MEMQIFDKHPSFFNHYVANHTYGDLLQTTYWGQLKSMTGWEPFPLGVVESGQICAGALVLKRIIPLTGKCIFYSPRGPLFSSIQALECLAAGVTDLARSHGALFWKMDPAIPTENRTWDQFAQKHLHKLEIGLDFDGVQPRFIMELDLRPDLETIFANMKSKARYNIRYAKRKGITVRLSHSKDDLQIFYPLLQETAARDRFSIRSFAYFEHLWDCLVPHRTAQLFLASHHGEPLAGAIAFRLGKRAWYVYGASANIKRNLQASYALQWEMIRWAKSLGCTVYDLRGVSGNLDPEHPLYGLYRFKEGFGAKLVEYAGEFDLPFSPLYRFWKPALNIYKRFRGNIL
ncbi:MAG: peptidoglycan bridge formation glycyltransferase FemA/FemB family protein [Firmicutes bacterium]|jgi:lipid II:glycine glycyltransferase (peptidoglycan interpeptide bridge formation enzyme)|nr:peptidoglycan bridge formation glycyltransferase FemA/FemB family protein [Bacillota bacterium]NLL87552.1 peptidoglycan bridge formation glycyltransferase FemA/FemB family protein [Bacillota bacterium]HKM17663.1 peptidoglycan bridge formation glycyltransferase FemA/FemB family protein [Limnochordia bacterium]